MIMTFIHKNPPYIFYVYHEDFSSFIQLRSIFNLSAIVAINSEFVGLARS